MFAFSVPSVCTYGVRLHVDLTLLIMEISKSGSVVYRGAMCEGERKKTNLFSEIAQGERDLRILFYLIKILIFVTGAKKFRSEHRSRTCQFTFVICKIPNGNILGRK